MRVTVWLISLAAMLLGISCDSREVDIITSEVSIGYLRSLASDVAQPITRDIKIVGYVVANDRLGELSRAFVIADESSGVEVQVDASVVDEHLPLYSHIELSCSGLYICREYGRVLLGAEPTDSYAVDRITMPELASRLRLISDTITAPRALQLAIRDITPREQFRYVMLSGVELIAEERGQRWCDIDTLSGEYMPSLRHFSDGRDTIAFITSGECRYSSERVPTGAIATLGIVDYYRGDVAFRITNHQVVTLED